MDLENTRYVAIGWSYKNKNAESNHSKVSILKYDWKIGALVFNRDYLLKIGKAF